MEPIEPSPKTLQRLHGLTSELLELAAVVRAQTAEDRVRGAERERELRDEAEAARWALVEQQRTLEAELDVLYRDLAQVHSQLAAITRPPASSERGAGSGAGRGLRKGELRSAFEAAQEGAGKRRPRWAGDLGGREPEA
jgi:hypothetical protein